MFPVIKEHASHLLGKFFFMRLQPSLCSNVQYIWKVRHCMVLYSCGVDHCVELCIWVLFPLPNSVPFSEIWYAPMSSIRYNIKINIATKVSKMSAILWKYLICTKEWWVVNFTQGLNKWVQNFLFMITEVAFL